MLWWNWSLIFIFVGILIFVFTLDEKNWTKTLLGMVFAIIAFGIAAGIAIGKMISG